MTAQHALSETEEDVIRVGAKVHGYREFRNFASLQIPGVQFVPVTDALSWYRGLRRLAGFKSRDVQLSSGLFVDLGLDSVDLFHFFFTLGLSTKPWVVTLSHYLPRWNFRSRWGHRLILSKNCRRLIAISQFARNRAEYLFRQHSPAPDAAVAKLVVLHPAQPTLIENMEIKPRDRDQIVFTLVGHEFFRKGGLEVLRAFARARDQRLPVKLQLVSLLRHGDYASKAGEQELAEARRLLQRLGPAVTHHQSLPNAAVLQLYVDSDVGLLPTYDDLYGYSVLEAQAAGCPVITTSVNSLLEINNPEVGWVIDVPVDEFGIALRKNPSERWALSEIITENLFCLIREIADRPQTVVRKGKNALERIRREHSPIDRARDLLLIYQQALQPPGRSVVGAGRSTA